MAMNRKIELWQPQLTTSNSGQRVRNFISKGLISAELNNRKGLETYQSYMTVSEHRALFRIRYNSEINATWYVIHNGVKYKIVSVIETQRLHWMDLITEFVDNEQN